ncbi:sugar-binding transcriptional regulator [Demequina aurantiaca]|uniref:sugar-binding transcriptional regulator n=1 Tax=Demequina aurantiaca TaxID=676200 RepID=UPI0007825AAB|nr:sugar-binding domain-containing protein [Demequina aurantiaca]
MSESVSDDRRTRAALRAAQMYYMQDLTMDAIARDLAMSRSSVSRLLGFARDTGLVEITVSSPLDHGAALERKILERFGVTAHVVPVPQLISDVDRLERVAMTAARLLSSWMDSNMTLGVAWGSTVSAVSRHVVRKDTHNSVIVQMNGAGNTQTTGIDYASEIMQRFGAAYSAQIQQFAVPAFFDDPAVKVGLWKERSVHRVLAVQARMDIAVFGLGSPFAEIPSHVYIGGYLDAADYQSLSADRVVGDVATVFYRRDGSSKDVSLNARGSGPDLQRLRRVPRRVCVVSGVQKLASLQGALEAGLVTDLILDESLATRLLDPA